MNRKLSSIGKLLAAYSSGDFSRRIAISDDLNEMDAIIGALNMLGEEMGSMTVSKGYCNDIFNAVSEMAIVISPMGLIEDVNMAACRQLAYRKDKLIGRPLNILMTETGLSFSKLIRNGVIHKEPERIWKETFLSSQGERIPVEIVARRLLAVGTGDRKRSLLTVSNISVRQLEENKMLRAVIDAQEKECQRLARDLHDSLGQRLSAVKFIVSAAIEDCSEPNLRQRLQEANKTLFYLLADTRKHCMNLMPSSLEDFGLMEATKELARQLEQAKMLSVYLEISPGIPELPKDLQIDLYRIIQEFVNNALKHGRATCLRVIFSYVKSGLMLRLSDNGRGFDVEKVKETGMGLKNMQTRIRSHKGEMDLRSRQGFGTSIQIIIPSSILANAYS
jgi:PAS domain S-box-containing protein